MALDRFSLAIQLIVGKSVMCNRIFLRKCARWSFVADKGVIRRKQYEAQTNQAMCLNIVTDTVGEPQNESLLYCYKALIGLD